MKDNALAIPLNTTENIKAILAKCFVDCPTALSEKEIINPEGHNIDDLIWQYNQDCMYDRNNN